MLISTDFNNRHIVVSGLNWQGELGVFVSPPHIQGRSHTFDIEGGWGEAKLLKLYQAFFVLKVDAVNPISTLV